VSDLRDRLLPLGKLDLLAGGAEKVRSYYAKLEQMGGRLDWEQRRRQVHAMLQVADLQEVANQLAEAQATYDRALALALALAWAHPGAAEHTLAAMAQGMLAKHDYNAGATAVALEHFKRSLVEAEAALALAP